MIPACPSNRWSFRLTNEGRLDHLLGLAVAAIAFLVYANSLVNGFVWDDTNVIVTNPALRGSPLSPFHGIDANRDYERLPYYRPLTILTFLLEERLHGLNPFLMHLLNDLLHAANAFLVYRLARSLLRDKHGALLAGLLFAVHPINSESVDFLSGGRNTMLAGFFILLTYLFHRRSILRDSLSDAIAGALFLLCGLLSKETGLMVVPFIVVQGLAPFRVIAPPARMRALLRLLPVAAALLCYLVMRREAMSSLGIQTSIFPGFGAQILSVTYKVPDLTMRLIDNLYIIPRYLLTVIWPAALTPRYAVPGHLGPLAAPLAAAWTCIIAALGWLLTRGRSRATLFGLVWLVAFWLPVSGIVAFPSLPMADRYLYLPAIGLWIIFADQAVRLLPSDDRARRNGMAAAVLILVALAGTTVRRNLDWYSDITLFTRCVEQYPDDAYGHAGLGHAYFLEHNRDIRYLGRAEAEYNRALALQPAMPGVHVKLGYIHLARGDSEGAVHYYTIALGLYPSDKDALLNRGIALENLGRSQEALNDFTRFLSLPGYELAEARPYAEARIRALTR